MNELTQFLDTYGYLVLPVLGFAEFAGLPVASIPLLVAAGALSASGVGPSPLLVVALVAAGGWLADVGWYTVGRTRGDQLVDLACGLSSNPSACVHRAQSRLERLGAGYIAASKFIPGTANLMASAAGIAGFPARVFLAADAVAVTAWAGVWIGVGIVFGQPVVAVVELALDYAALVGVAVVAGVVGGVIWRIIRVRRHRRGHEAAPAEPLPAPR